MAQNNQQRSGQGRGQGSRDQAPVRSANQQLSDEARSREAFGTLFQQIERLRPEITAVLRGAPFSEFRSAVMIAVRNNPKLLECYIPSLVTACMKSAWDRLPPDGKLAVIIPSNNKVKIDGRDVWRKEARYQSMVAGLRLQILRTGKVDDLQSEIVYANEVSEGRFKYTRGSTPNIEHEPIVIDAARGDAVGAYSIAWLGNGRVSIEYMTGRQILDVKENSQSGDVWKGAFDKEMWRKTVTRRHRKALPGGEDIYDAEAVDMFPQFAAAPDASAESAPPRPKRSDYQELQHQPDQGHSDFGGMDVGGGEMTAEEVAREERGLVDQTPAQLKSDRTEEQKHSEPASSDAGPAIPQTMEEWQIWASDVRRGVAERGTADDVNSFRRDHQPMIDVAPGKLGDEIDDLFFNRIADIMGGGKPQDGAK